MICPYCRTEVVAPGDGALFCNGCGTPHHAECYEENGGCTLFGCKFAPADEPKVAVSSAELSAGQAWQRPTPTGFGDVNTTLNIPSPRVQRVAPPPPASADVGGSAENSRQGYVTPGGIFSSLTSAQPALRPKSRIAFIMLGIFFGSLGIHNFYAGFIGRGVAQLCITLFTVGYGSVVSWIWAIVEICTVEHDKRNIAFT